MSKNSIQAGFWTRIAEKLVYISGNVGIGTTAPTEKLEVVGNIKATKFIGDGSELTNISSGTIVFGGLTSSTLTLDTPPVIGNLTSGDL